MPQDDNINKTETVSESPVEETVQNSSNEQYIAESKKYRKRAQEAEARIAEYELKLTKQEEQKLKEKEDFKALYEKVSSENEVLTKKALKHDEYEARRKKILLDQHPEEDREQLNSLGLDTLEYVTSKVMNVKPNNAPEVINKARTDMPSKPYSQLTEDEKKANWGNIVKEFNAK
jgi:hypothetical protein